MLGRRKPDEVAALGGRPIDWAGLAGGGWVVAFDGELAVTRSGDGGTPAVERHAWSECEGATWSEEKRQVAVTFVDGSQPLIITFAPGEKQKLVYVIRERVQRSIVFQEGRDLPSGAMARGMVRRNGDESLFTQVLIDGQTGHEDDAEIAKLEASLRDVTGITED